MAAASTTYRILHHTAWVVATDAKLYALIEAARLYFNA